MLRNFPKFLSLDFVGLKKVPQNSHQISRTVSLQDNQEIYRRASGGAQGEEICGSPKHTMPWIYNKCEFFSVAVFQPICWFEQLGLHDRGAKDGEIARERERKREREREREKERERERSIYAVKLNKNWSNSCPSKSKKLVQVFCFFLGGGVFLKISLSLQKEEDCSRKTKKTTKNTISKSKIGPFLLRNILGPVFNLDLDHFLTLKICQFYVFWLKPLFLSCFQQNMQNLKTHHYLWTHLWC